MSVLSESALSNASVALPDDDVRQRASASLGISNADIYSMVAKIIRQRRSARGQVVDVGCGSGSLLPFLIALVIIGPVTEEVVFRGFLFRGLSESFLGVAGTLVATSAAWAALHVQYDWMTIAQIFLIGLLLGWLRWASGSTLLTIMLHVLANFAACIQAAIKVEWMS